MKGWDWHISSVLPVSPHDHSPASPPCNAFSRVKMQPRPSSETQQPRRLRLGLFASNTMTTTSLFSPWSTRTWAFCTTQNGPRHQSFSFLLCEGKRLDLLTHKFSLVSAVLTNARQFVRHWTWDLTHRKIGLLERDEELCFHAQQSGQEEGSQCRAVLRLSKARLMHLSTWLSPAGNDADCHRTRKFSFDQI